MVNLIFDIVLNSLYFLTGILALRMAFFKRSEARLKAYSRSQSLKLIRDIKENSIRIGARKTLVLFRLLSKKLYEIWVGGIAQTILLLFMVFMKWIALALIILLAIKGSYIEAVIWCAICVIHLKTKNMFLEYLGRYFDITKVKISVAFKLMYLHMLAMAPFGLSVLVRLKFMLSTPLLSIAATLTLIAIIIAQSAFALALLWNGKLESKLNSSVTKMVENILTLFPLSIACELLAFSYCGIRGGFPNEHFNSEIFFWYNCSIDVMNCLLLTVALWMATKTKSLITSFFCIVTSGVFAVATSYIAFNAYFAFTTGSDVYQTFNNSPIFTQSTRGAIPLLVATFFLPIAGVAIITRMSILQVRRIWDFNIYLIGYKRMSLPEIDFYACGAIAGTLKFAQFIINTRFV